MKGLVAATAVLAGLLTAPSAAEGANRIWNVNAGGSWTTASNWLYVNGAGPNTGYPNGVGADVRVSIVGHNSNFNDTRLMLGQRPRPEDREGDEPGDDEGPPHCAHGATPNRGGTRPCWVVVCTRRAHAEETAFARRPAGRYQKWREP